MASTSSTTDENHKNIDFDDKRWVIEIRSFFEEEPEAGGNELAPVSIFSVPNTIRAIKPEAYTPQLIALGPYHHWREDLYKLERYKLVCARRVQARFKGLKLQQIVDKLIHIDSCLRGCYHRFFDTDVETLAWMMAVDGTFLLDFLHTYARHHSSTLVLPISSSPSPSPGLTRIFLGSEGKKVAYESILRDVLMLENQLPFVLLKKITQMAHFTTSDVADDLLGLILIDFCREISPLKLIDHQEEAYPRRSMAVEHYHLLDLLYHLIVPCRSSSQQQQQQFSEELESIKSSTSPTISLGRDVEVLSRAWKLLSKLNIGVVRKINTGLMLPIKLISRLKIFSNATSALEKVIPDGDDEGGDEGVDINVDHHETTRSRLIMKAPLVEEIMIPSVTQLVDAGVEFCPTEGDITSIEFDSKGGRYKFYLPVIHLDGNTEVTMRNLVAYEALAVPGPLVLARYTELMNGIIDTSEDARLLREKKIIINRLKSDQEVADLWNGMSRAIRLSKVSYMDKAIVDVNAYYNGTPKRKFYKAMCRYVYRSWRILIVIATILLLVLMALQSTCSVVSCPKLFNTSGGSSTGDDDAN